MTAHTPFFRAWLPRLAPMGSRVSQTFRQVRAYTLNQLEERFGHCLPQNLFPKAAKKTNSRNRIYTRPRTFWSMLWQGFNLAPGREVVRQIQALFQLQDGPEVSENDGAYCRAKARLPLSEFPRALTASAEAADQLLPASSALQGRSVKVVDGTTLILQDTPKNRRAYPALQCPQPNFPMMRVVVLFSLLSGAILSVASASLRTGELELVYAMLSLLQPKDILLGDRGYGNYVLLALLQHLQLHVDFIGRSVRGVDGRRRLQRLGKNDWLMIWQKGSSPSRWLPKPLWQALPGQLTVRIVRGSCFVKGYRVRQVTLVTTLLDAERYPAQEILQAYLRRWRLEMCLNNLKTFLELEQLRSHSPAMIQKELYAHLIDHNLVRYVMAQAASEHHVPLERLSFKGTLDGLRQFTQAMSQTRSKTKRRQLWDKFLETVAADQVPDRPGRREPRAVKRVKNKYPRLSAPRHLFRDKVKREVRRTNARLRTLGLK